MGEPFDEYSTDWNLAIGYYIPNTLIKVLLGIRVERQQTKGK